VALRNQHAQPYAELGDACDLSDTVKRCLGRVGVRGNYLNDMHARPGLQVLGRAIRDFDAAIQDSQAIVMPGCLGLDALWQLLGFYLAWNGGQGRGRALGVGKVKFTGQILPTSKLVTFQLDIKRVISRKLVLGIADGSVSVDGREIYTAEDLRVGLFTSTENF